MELLGLIVFGAFIGGLSRFFMKGKQPMGIISTIILGMLGALAGYYLSSLIGVSDTKGVDWIRLAISVACTILFIGAYLALMGRPKNTNEITNNDSSF